MESLRSIAWCCSGRMATSMSEQRPPEPADPPQPQNRNAGFLPISEEQGHPQATFGDERLTVHPGQQVQPWAEGIYELFKAHRVELISFVPDAGHKQLITYCQRDSALRTVVLTTEE